MNRFFSYIDIYLDAPQSLQHLAIREYTKCEGAAVVFYGSEDHLTLPRQLFLRSKLERLKDIDGICFFSFHQFRRGDGVDWDLLKQILSKGWEVHFARERFSVRSLKSLQDAYFFLHAVDFTLRDGTGRGWAKEATGFLAQRDLM